MLPLLALVVCAKSPLLPFAMSEWRKQPETRIEDAYKWLYHATHGGEHAVTNDSGPRRWMEREWGGLSAPFKHEPEVQPLSPDGRIVRINLRPYKARGGDSEMLLAIFVESARQFRSDKQEFVREWTTLGSTLKSKRHGHLTWEQWIRLDRTMKPLSYPAIHHSEAYERAYKPAYRVILRQLWTR